MCGIAGFFSQQAMAPTIAEAMLTPLRPRGPDAIGQHSWDAHWQKATNGSLYNALLHTRLAIIDPRACAHQPMKSTNQQIWLVFNGEVYDWQSDKKQLEQSGFVFHTHSDTEFILHGYQAWGIETLLTKLRGMFAFAILDLQQGKLHLARDRMGEKPLVYSLLNGQFAFASLIRALLPFIPSQQRHFSPEAIDAYLAHRYIPAPHTIFTSIQRLENGYRLEFDLQTRQLHKQRYWQPQAIAHDWLVELDYAIALRTVADRPVGILLSSGIDSTVIASRLAQQNFTHLTTFTAAFPHSALDESADAANAANAMGFNHEIIATPHALTDGDFARIVADLDQPFADPSSFPMWYLARAVSQQVKVVLLGDGGDELLAGYKRFKQHLRTHWRQRWCLPLPLYSSPNNKGLNKWLTELSLSWNSAYMLRFSGFTPGQRLFLQDNRPLSKLCYWRNAEDIGPTLPGTPAGLATLLAIDFANTLPDYILQKSDLCTMAHGLEGRAPLLDHLFYQTLLTVAAVQRYTQPPKLLLQKALHPALPADFMQRKKRGFNPPLNHWLKTSLINRSEGLGARLAHYSQGQLSAGAIDTFSRSYQHGKTQLAEQMLQLLILDESLAQLCTLNLPNSADLL